ARAVEFIGAAFDAIGGRFPGIEIQRRASDAAAAARFERDARSGVLLFGAGVLVLRVGAHLAARWLQLCPTRQGGRDRSACRLAIAAGARHRLEFERGPRRQARALARLTADLEIDATPAF